MENLTNANLYSCWIDLKKSEKDFAAKRLEVEVELYNRNADKINRNGSSTIKDDGFKMKVVSGYTRKWDQEKLDEVVRSVDGGYDAFKTVWKEDKKAFDCLPEEAKKSLIVALTEKPKKPTFTVEVLGD